MKVKNLCILGICLLFSSNMFGQDPDDKSIVGTWVSETDNTSKLVFTTDGKCQQYSENNLIATETYILSNTTPQCGENVSVNNNTMYLSLKDIVTNDMYCYEIYGLTQNTLSYRYLEAGTIMVYLRSQTGTVTMQSGFNNVGSTISNEGLDVTLKLLYSPSSTMNIGTNYFVGNISQNLRPEVAHTISLTINSQVWAVTINPDGNIYCKIVSGSAQPAKQTILQILNYPLYDPANQ